MDGRKSREIKEVLDGYRDEDAGDLIGNELNELVENMTGGNACEGNFWKSDERNQKIVMDEQIVKNSVMDAILCDTMFGTTFF